MKVVLTETFKKQLKKLDAAISKRVLDYLEQIELLDNPRSRGKALTSNFSGLWRYRVGDYRILCRIRDDRLIITVIEIGHQSCLDMHQSLILSNQLIYTFPKRSGVIFIFPLT